MIGNRLLNEIVSEKNIHSPAQILNELNKMVIKALRQDTTNNNDGMDLCLCKLEQDHQTNKQTLTYAGAKRPLMRYNSVKKSIEIFRGTRKSIGGIATTMDDIDFEEQRIQVNKGDILYLSTDGLTDQCNPHRKKFTQKRLIQVLDEITDKSPDEQKDYLEQELDKFQKGYFQRDDITLVGLKI